MGKDKNKPPQLQLSPLESILQNTGVPQYGDVYPTEIVSVPDPITSEILEEKRWLTTRDRIARLGAGLIGTEEEKVQKDFYEETVEDPDGYLRTYQFVKDLRTGEVRKLGLVRDADAIKIEDLQTKKKVDSQKEQEIRSLLLGKMFQDTDPVTGKFYKNAGIDLYASAIMSSVPGYLISLGQRALGDSYAGKYPGVTDAFVNKLEIGEGGELKFDGTTLKLPEEILADTYEWFTKSTVPKPEGFVDTLISQGITFAMDLPFYFLGGSITGKVLSKIAPAFSKSTGILTSIPRHQISTFSTLMLGGTPRTVTHTLDSGVDGFLEDIKHNAEFALVAGTFGYAGEQVGIGVSKLFGRAVRTSHNTLVDILRKNPQLTATLSGGFSSGALGYTVGGDNFEDRLASGLLFASMHFATPSAWKSFAKEKNKDVMVERDTFDDLVLALRSGKTLNEAIKELKITEPNYYLREGNKLYEIDKDLFATQGVVQKFENTAVEYKPGEYSYITESLPFYRKVYKEALKDYRLSKIADKIEVEGFKDVVNPYPKGTEEFLEFEYNKRSTAERLALIHYSKDLYRQIKNNALPEIPGIKEILKVSSEGLGLPTRVYRQMIERAFVEYIKNPEEFLGKLKSEGGSLDFLPSEYRKSFESALPQIEVQVKRWLNQLTTESVERLKSKAVTITPELISEFMRIKDMQDLYNALEKIGYSSKVFEDLQKQIKAQSLSENELRTFIEAKNEEFKARKLDYEGGVELLRRDYRHWQRMLELFTPEEIREIGKTGVIPPEVRETLNKMDIELGQEPVEVSPKKVIRVLEDIPAPTVREPVKRTIDYIEPHTGEKGQVEVITETEYLLNKGINPPKEEGAEGFIIQRRAEGAPRFVRVEVVDNIVNEFGLRTDNVLVRFPEGSFAVIPSEQIEPAISNPEKRSFSKALFLGKAYSYDTATGTGDDLSSRIRIIARTDMTVLPEEFRDVQSLKPVQYMLRLTDEQVTKQNRFWKPRYEGGVNMQAYETMKTLTEENVKKFLDSTISLPDAIRNMEKTLNEILQGELTPTQRRVLEDYITANEKLFLIGKYMDAVRVAVVSTKDFNGQQIRAFPNYITRLGKELRYLPSVILLDGGLSPYQLVETFAHEIVHSVFALPNLRFNWADTSHLKTFEAPFYGTDLYKRISRLRKELWLRFQELSTDSMTPHLRERLIYALEPSPDRSFEEIFTIAFTNPYARAWFATIPAEGVRPNKSYNALYQIIDYFREGIAKFFNINRTTAERIFNKKEYTALDEIFNITEEWLRETGIASLDGKLQSGVANRGVLEVYADVLERTNNPDRYFRELLNRTERDYERTLFELGINREESGVEPNREFSFRQKETLNTAQIPNEVSNISPNINAPANRETFRLGAQNTKDILEIASERLKDKIEARKKFLEQVHYFLEGRDITAELRELVPSLGSPFMKDFGLTPQRLSRKIQNELKWYEKQKKEVSDDETLKAPLEEKIQKLEYYKSSIKDIEVQVPSNQDISPELGRTGVVRTEVGKSGIINQELGLYPGEPTMPSISPNMPKERNIPVENFAPIEGAYSTPKIVDKTAEESVKKDYPESSASVRKPVKVKEIAKYDEVRKNRESIEVETVSKVPLKVKGKEFQVLPKPRELAHRIYMENRLYRGSKALKNYFYQSIVPVYRKDNAPRFRREVYEPGEEMIRYAPYYFNSIVKRVDGWRSGEAWRTFAKPDRMSGIPTTPEGKKFLEAFKNYEYGRYTGKIERELTWDEFSEWAGFNSSQKKMLDIYRGTLKAGIDVMKDLKTRYLVELESALANKYLGEKVVKEIAEKNKVDADKVDEFLNNNPKIKEEYARKFIEGKYKDWDKTVYYNSVRPVSPSTVILEFSKSTGRVDKDGNPILDRVRTYADTRLEAEGILKEMINKGWTKEEMYEISSIIKHPDQWGKLRAEQLLKLAEEGHIPYNDKVVQALLEITKKGVDIHTIQKDYIPGMKYTAKEFENQLIDFLREAIYGSYKSYTFTKINDNLLKWRGELNDLSKGLSQIKDKSIDDKTLRELEAEYQYAYGYYNQLKAPEKSVIDKLRGLTFSYLIGGIKPSFLFMQSVQNLQMGLHVASKELGNFTQASQFLGEATAEAMNYAFMLRAKRKGQKLEGYPHDKELLALLDKMELMGKLKPVGISEMAGISVEPDFYYSNKANRYAEGFIRINNILGAGVEKLTRIQSAGLFFKVGKQKGLTGEALEKFVLDNVDKTMTEFGKGGRAPLFESKSTIPNQGTLATALKKSFLSLKTFSFYNYSLYHNLIKEKAWGALASKAMVGMGLHGIKSFPLMASLFMIAGLFTDEDIDYQAMKFANDLDELVPVPLGKFLDKGLASALGTGVDFSNTFAEDSPLLTDLIANTYSKTWEGKLLELSLGAPLGFSRNMVTGVTEFYETLTDNILGDQFLTDKQRKLKIEKLVKAVPGIWIQNIFRAMSYEKDGVTLKGQQLVKREDLTEWDIFMKALSFPLEKVNVAYLEKEYGVEAKITKQKMVISTAKKYIKEMRTDKRMPLEARLKEIEKAEESMKEAKKQIIQLEKERKEEND